jgi:hypothetical protein
VHERVLAMVAETQSARARVREQCGEEGDREDGLAKLHCALTGREGARWSGAVPGAVGNGGMGVGGVWGRSGKGVINRGGGGARVSTAARDSRGGAARKAWALGGGRWLRVWSVVEWCGSRHALQKLPS